MFNLYTHKSESKVVALTQVIEKTITPDKVTDMYDKVRAEVEDAIVKTYKVESSVMSGYVFEVHYATREMWTKFTLNGKDYVNKTFPTEKMILSPEKAITLLEDHFRKVVAREIVFEAARAGKAERGDE